MYGLMGNFFGGKTSPLFSFIKIFKIHLKICKHKLVIKKSLIFKN